MAHKLLDDQHNNQLIKWTIYQQLMHRALSFTV